MNTETATTTPEKKRDPIKHGSHVLASYLQACNIPFTRGSESGLLLIPLKGNPKRVLNVRVVNTLDVPDDAFQVVASEVTSSDLDTAVKAFWKITNTAGWGTPMPVDRGARPEKGRTNYHDDFEGVYLRHSVYRRSPNQDAAALEPYMRTVQSAAKRAHFKWNSVFTSMGYEVDDLVNVGRVYLTSFLHNYADSEDQTDRVKLLTAYLNQRYGEWAKITYKKAVDASCLPSMVKSGPIGVNDDGEPIDYIETYAEAETAPPDEEYEAGKFTVKIKKSEGSIMEAKLEIKPSGMLGADLYLNGSLLPRVQAEAFREAMNSGRVQIVPVVTAQEPEEIKPVETELERRQRVRGELMNKLNAMSPEAREAALSYAAYSRDYDPDARREARRLSDELACPKCLRKVPSGTVCTVCNVEARPRYGVDYEAFRNKLRAQNHNMAEAMTAVVPESEMRSRQKRPQVSNPAPLVAALPDESAPQATTVSGMTLEEIRRRSEELAAKLMAKLPAELKCPKCKKLLPKDTFGIRVPRNKETGIPERAVRQSYCKPCRGPKKAT